MRRMRDKMAVLAASATMLAAVAGGRAGAQQQPATSVPTFSTDVAPIVYKHCVSCHRPGEIAPMSLLTYEQARPYARAIANAVTNRAMPPWHADAPAGTFHNERLLSDAERQTRGVGRRRRAERRTERHARGACVRRWVALGPQRRCSKC